MTKVAKQNSSAGKAGVTFIVVGIGVGDAPLSYPKDTLGEAGHLASKMADNGVRSVRIVDNNGKEYSLNDGDEAFRLSKPDGWTFYGI